MIVKYSSLIVKVGCSLFGTGLTLILILLPTRLLAQTAQNQCIVWLDRTDRNAWTKPVRTTLEQCATEVGYNGDYDREGWAGGVWGEIPLSVNRQGEVYYHDQRTNEWQYWDVITLGDSRNITNGDADKDGTPDDTDQCPVQPETLNGFSDQDGCPDSLEGLKSES